MTSGEIKLLQKERDFLLKLAAESVYMCGYCENNFPECRAIDCRTECTHAKDCDCASCKELNHWKWNGSY